MLTIKMERYGPHGWEWEHHYDDITGDEEHGCFRTNEDGRGLWIWDEPGQTYLQLRDTSRFRLPSCRIMAYNEIRRWVTKNTLKKELTCLKSTLSTYPNPTPT